MKRIILASSIACAIIIAGLIASQNLTSDKKVHEESAGL